MRDPHRGVLEFMNIKQSYLGINNQSSSWVSAHVK